MSVTDLTNTTWLLNNDIAENNPNFNPSTAPYQYIHTANISFISNGNSYTSLKHVHDYDQDEKTLYYDNTTACFTLYPYEDFYWGSDNYKTITITGGTDVTNNELITWLMANATQQVITDLTNTTWVINDIPILISSLTSFYINFVSNNENFGVIRMNSSQLQYGEWESGEWDFSTKYFASNHTWNNNAYAYKTIEITGGPDATNPNLISWLQGNATQQETPTPTPTSTGKIGDLPIIKKHFGSLEIIKEVLNGVTIYEKEAPTPPTPTIYNNIHIHNDGDGYVLYKLNNGTQVQIDENQSITLNNVEELSVYVDSPYSSTTLKIGTTDGASDIYSTHASGERTEEFNVTQYLQDGCYISAKTYW